MYTKYMLALLMGLFLLSCSDDESTDTTRPEIEVLAPADHSHFHAGDSFELRAQLSDNEALASWKANIHFNGDGHTHKSSSTKDTAVEWEAEWTGDLAGSETSFLLEQPIEIPANAEHGEYHLVVMALDRQGNETAAYSSFEVEAEDHQH